MKVLEHEFGLIAIMEWYSDPRFQHYLYSTLNISKEIKPFGCYQKVFGMKRKGLQDILGVIQFLDPEFEENWKKRNS